MPPATTAQPIVSIIVRTVYGRREFLREALTSLTKQTFKQLEVIIVEDGSQTVTDLVAEFSNAADWPQFRYVPLGKVGRAAAGNEGLSKARGRYLGFLDDDDQLFPMHVEILTQALDNDPQAPAVYANADARETVVHSLSPLSYEEKTIPSSPVPFWPTLLEESCIPIQAVLFRRELYERYGGFHPDLAHFEEWELWLRYAQDGFFTKIEDVTSFYRKPSEPHEIQKRYKRAKKFAPHIYMLTAEYQWVLPLSLMRGYNRSSRKVAWKKRLCALVMLHPILISWARKLREKTL